MMKKKTIAKGKCFGLPTRHRDFLIVGVRKFAKAKMLGTDWHPTGPDCGELRHFWVVFVSVIKHPQLKLM